MRLTVAWCMLHIACCMLHVGRRHLISHLVCVSTSKRQADGIDGALDTAPCEVRNWEHDALDGHLSWYVMCLKGLVL